MKKVLQILCCVGILASCLCFSIALCGKSFVNDVLVSASIDKINIEERLNSVLELSDLNVDEATNAKLKEITNDVANDEAVQAKIREFVGIGVQDIIRNESKGDQGALDEAMKEEILSYSDEISAATNNQISPSEVKSQLTTILDDNSINEFYSDTMRVVQSDYTDSDKSVLGIVNTLQGSPLFFGSLIMLIIFSVAVIFLSEYKSRGFLALGITYIPCAIITFISSTLFSIVMVEVLNQLSTKGSINVLPMQITAGIFVIMSIAGFVVSSILSKKENNA